jgi:hypothetical protein
MARSANLADCWLVITRADKYFAGGFDRIVGVEMTSERLFLLHQATERCIAYLAQLSGTPVHSLDKAKRSF